MDTRRSSGYKKKEQIQEEELDTIQREGLEWIQGVSMDTKRRNGYKEKEWVQGEVMDTRRRNGYKEKEWIQGEGMDTRRRNECKDKEWIQGEVKGWIDG